MSQLMPPASVIQSLLSHHVSYHSLNTAQEFVYDPCGWRLSDLIVHSESVDYGACTFTLNGHRVEHRSAKITPTKTGQFVTIWKRDPQGVTQPFDVLDGVNLFVITVSAGNALGQFVFPATVLALRGILSQNGKGGKRGIRVYPPWDTVSSKQAANTQAWQLQYFAFISSGRANLNAFKKLFDSADQG